jgi:hypothetical protein
MGDATKWNYEADRTPTGGCGRKLAQCLDPSDGAADREHKINVFWDQQQALSGCRRPGVR